MPPKSRRTPIYRDAGFLLVDIPTMKRAFAEELDHPREPVLYIYSRYRSPNVVEAEAQIMELEGAEWSVLTQSGLAAIDIALSIFQRGGKTGRWLFFSEIYGGTNTFIDKVLIERRGIDVIRFSPLNNSYSVEELDKLMGATKPEILFFEAMSNPMLIVPDAEAVIRVAKSHGARVIVDNTFATPMLWKPLASGADIVMHSVTKYLSGHGNLSAGVLSGNDPELARAAIEYRKLVGHMLSPDDAYRLFDMIKTFDLRFAQQCNNAKAIAEFLNQHSMIDLVMYPALTSHTTHGQAASLFRGKGYGAIVTFDIKGEDPGQKRSRCEAFVKNLEATIPLIPTLGDTETILMPVEPVWGDKFPFPGMVRLSVGIEPTGKLIELIAEALEF